MRIVAFILLLFKVITPQSSLKSFPRRSHLHPGAFEVQKSALTSRWIAFWVVDSRLNTDKPLINTCQKTIFRDFRTYDSALIKQESSGFKKLKNHLKILK